jgi:uncharacterized OsmC-like protein
LIIIRSPIDALGVKVDTISNAIERLESVLTRRSDFGVGTAQSVTTLSAGLSCTTEEGPWHIASDLPEALGGGGGAPTPGVLVRAALGSCMAMSYRLRAAKHGVELTSIRVTVEADSELAGMLSCDASAPPGYSEVRYHVEVESPAPPDDVRRVIDEGDQLSPLLDVFTRTTTMRRTTSIRESRA